MFGFTHLLCLQLSIVIATRELEPDFLLVGLRQKLRQKWFLSPDREVVSVLMGII
jgi:hypothetical protein